MTDVVMEAATQLSSNNSTFKNKICLLYKIHNFIKNDGGRRGSSTNVEIIIRFESYRMIRYEIGLPKLNKNPGKK